jgi:hypothetical protein
MTSDSWTRRRCLGSAVRRGHDLRIRPVNCGNSADPGTPQVYLGARIPAGQRAARRLWRPPVCRRQTGTYRYISLPDPGPCCQVSARSAAGAALFTSTRRNLPWMSGVVAEDEPSEAGAVRAPHIPCAAISARGSMIASFQVRPMHCGTNSRRSYRRARSRCAIPGAHGIRATRPTILKPLLFRSGPRDRGRPADSGVSRVRGGGPGAPAQASGRGASRMAQPVQD